MRELTGDSITSGVGARAGSVLDIATEYRGSTFSVGGDRSWREFVTLPNILKLFNRKLYGQSYGVSRCRLSNYRKWKTESTETWKETPSQ